MFNGSGFRMLRLKRTDLEKLSAEGRKTDIELIGMVFADDDVTPELIESTISRTAIHGRIIASPQVKQALLAREAI